MPKNLSTSLKSNINTLSSTQHPLLLVEIHHPNLAMPIRLVNDKCDIVSNGDTYIPCPFNLTLPDESENSSPRATMEITNIGRALSAWVERTVGGKDAQVRVMIIQRSNPNFVEWDIWTDLSNVTMDIEKITSQLTYDDILNKAAVRVLYTTEKAPGLY